MFWGGNTEQKYPLHNQIKLAKYSHSVSGVGQVIKASRMANVVLVAKKV